MRSRFSLSLLSIRMSGVLIATNGFHSLSLPLIMVSYNLQPPTGVSVTPAQRRELQVPREDLVTNTFSSCAGKFILVMIQFEEQAN